MLTSKGNGTQGIDDVANRWSLKNGDILALDTTCFIYFFENERYRKWADAVHPILSGVEEGRWRAVTSSLSLLECLVAPLRAENRALAETYKAALYSFPNLRVIDIHAAVAERAAELRAAYGIRTRDACHLAAALVAVADVFVTNDDRLAKVKDLRICALGTLLEP